ncbi:hypothetical protein QZJ86_17530 [Methylomonas montana]|uniref:hypothetical protein n=1 Tax=Methylomonas montana TaxID=3058963 RepID=UPI002657BD41|nr:hypothetical protein [Methylomonas montana]WKJ89797.1 hypothetical protein QZJ86_17530 [Methylomonas montana]
MSPESVFSLLVGIPIGLISGLYTGLIVTRYARFAELRNEALRIIRAIDYIEEGPLVKISNNEDVPKLINVASDLLFLKHKKAGEQVCQLLKNISDKTNDAKLGKISVVEFGEQHSKWQKTARELPGNKIVLWALWGNL